MSRAQSISFSEIDLDSPVAAQFLAYPASSLEELSGRIKELRSLDIESILSGGPTVIGGTQILGKGCVGLAVKARHKSIGLCALKIRRTDADRQDMAREANFHRVANNVHVGPTLYAHSRNFLVMDLVQGEKILSWSTAPMTEGDAKSVVNAVLDQCHRLDLAGLDHGELSRIGSHVIVSDNCSATILDFESASTLRKPSNVTSAAQALLLYGKVAKRIAAVVGEPDRAAALSALRRYKAQPSGDNLESLRDVLIAS